MIILQRTIFWCIGQKRTVLLSSQQCGRSVPSGSRQIMYSANWQWEILLWCLRTYQTICTFWYWFGALWKRVYYGYGRTYNVYWYRLPTSTGMGVRQVWVYTGIPLEQKLAYVWVFNRNFIVTCTVYDQLSSTGPFSKKRDTVNASTSEKASGGEPSSLSSVEQRRDCSTIMWTTKSKKT